jgi:hypothetical protein
MKMITILIGALMFAFMGYSQSATEEVDLFQAAFGMEKKAVIANFVKPNDAQKDAFWLLYDEYEAARKENGKKRIDLLEQYAKTYQNMSNEAADLWTKEVIKLQTVTDKLVVTYYNKIKKATNPIVATQFYQIENYILTAVRMEILENIPFVGEK